MSGVRDTGRWLAEQLTAGRDAVRALSTPQLGTSSIEAGAIEEYDVEGTLVSTVGEQFDGTHAAVTLGGPVPPEPAAPTVTTGINTAEVRWNGKFADDALSPMDFSHVAVHASRDESFDPDATTQKATIRGESGDTATVALDSGEWYFLLVAVSQAGKWSDPSEAVLGEVEDFLQDAVTDALIDLDTKYDGVIQDAGQLDSRLQTAETDLAAHDTRIADAETELTDAFGQLGTVDTRIDTAKSGAIATAATDAQAKADAAKQAAITAAASDAQTKADAALAAANAQVAQVIARGQSLVRNGDFEAPDGWQTGSFNAVVSGTSRSGTKSMKIGPNPGGNVWPTSEWVPGATGRTYYLEAWFKRVGEEVKALGVGFVVQAKTAVGGTGTITPGRVDSTTISTTTWTKVAITYTLATADAVSVRFAPWILAGNNTYYVDDMLVVDVTEAQAALTKATDAAAAAATAQTAAGDARTQADAALTMANSKSTVYYSDQPATGTGKSAGDLWRQRNAGKEIIAEWQWNGSGWEKQTVSGMNVSNMDIGYLTAGSATMSQALINKLVAGTANFQTVDVKNLFATAATMQTAVIDKLWTDVVNSRLITTSMLAVGDFTNLVPNGRGELGAGVGWTSGLVYDTGDKPSGVVASFKSTAGQGTFSANTQDFLVEPGAQYLFSAWIKADKPNSKFYFEMRDQAGALIPCTTGGLTPSAATGGTGVGYPISNVTVPTVWTKYYAVITPGPTTSKLRVAKLYFNHPNGTELGATVGVAGVQVQRRSGSVLLEDGIVTAEKLIANLALVSDIIAGAPAGQHARMTPTGFKVLAPVDGGTPAEVVRMGNSDGDDVIGVVGPDGTVRAGLNKDGTVTGQDAVIANDITLAGDSLVGTLKALPKGIIGWQQFGVPAAGWPTLGSSGGEVGLFEIGWETPETEARMYAVNVPPILIKSLSGSTGRHGLVMRITTDGTTPSIPGNSQIVGRSYASGVPTGDYATGQFNNVLVSSKNGPYIRILVSLISTVASSIDGTLVEVSVEDKGLLQPTTGSLSTGGVTPQGGGPTAPPTDPVVTKSVTYASTSVQSFLGNNARYDFNAGKGYQGLQPGTSNGNLKSLWTFPSVTGFLAGATVNKIEAYFYFEHWYASAGGTARIVAHGNSGQPTTYSSLILAISSPNWPRGAGRWVTIPSSLYAGFKSGTYKGFGLEGDGTYNTYGIANAAKIRLTYTK